MGRVRIHLPGQEGGGLQCSYETITVPGDGARSFTLRDGFAFIYCYDSSMIFVAKFGSKSVTNVPGNAYSCSVSGDLVTVRVAVSSTTMKIMKFEIPR